MNKWTKQIYWVAAFFIVLQILAYPVQSNLEAEKAVIAKIINDHIGWFENKDFDLLFSTMADDPNFFMFQLDSKSTIRGFEEFRKYSVGWRNPEVKYVRHEIQNLRINFSQMKNVAWFSCRLEDCGQVRGVVKCFHSRWTGILEKRGGRWIIVQEHFSLDSDKVAEEAVNAYKEKKIGNPNT